MSTHIDDKLYWNVLTILLEVLAEEENEMLALAEDVESRKKTVEAHRIRLAKLTAAIESLQSTENPQAVGQ